MRIIINADDFGINETVTAEIESMIEKGRVTSTTIMANGKCLEEVKRFAILHPEISFGVHLCLSEFDSITKSDVLRQAGLIDEGGVFIRKAIFSLKKFDDERLVMAIKEELKAQIQTVKALGVSISHADSHHHVHTIYQLRKIFTEVLEEQGIEKVRLGGGFPWRSRIHIKSWLQRVSLNRMLKNNFHTADAFFSYSQFLKKRSNNRKNMVVETMCHPGHPSKRYIAEMKLVQEKVVNRSKDVEIISYLSL